MEKLLGLIGLAKRAGKISAGEALCSEKIKSRDARLVIIAEDASDNTKKAVTNSCKYYNVPYVIFASKEQLGTFTGGGFKSAAAVCDRGFAKAICEKLGSSGKKGQVK